MRRLLLPTACFVFVLLSASAAQAAYIDLTTAAAQGTINSALFIQGTTGAGTGVFPAFVEVTGNDPVLEAYNTTDNDTLDNGNSDTFNHEIQVSELRITTVNSVDYYGFILDINESNNSTDTFLSLDALKLYTSTVANQTDPPNPLPSGTLRYDMGAGNGAWLKFDLESGGGWSDVLFLVPVQNFAGALGSDYVYLYSSFGSLGVNPTGAPAGNYGASDGPEQWALNPGRVGLPPPLPDPATVPEPGSLMLLGSGLAGLAAAVRRRRQQK